MATTDQIIRGLQRKVNDQANDIKRLEDQIHELELKQTGGGAAVDEIAKSAVMRERELLDRIEALQSALNFASPEFSYKTPAHDSKLVLVRDNGPVLLDVTVRNLGNVLLVG